MTRISRIAALLFLVFAGRAAVARNSRDGFAVRGWQLHNAAPRAIESAIRRAKGYGVNHLQLSHGIVMNVDEGNASPTRRKIINRAVKQAHRAGMRVYVWAHELTLPGKSRLPVLDLDPEGGGRELWAARQEAYRVFFKNCPDVDGIILMFGSSNVEVWRVLGVSKWNREHRGADRVRLTIDKISAVVRDELKKDLIVRTFNHRPVELGWLREAFAAYPPGRIGIMPKCVPQDWQPYYPHNPVIAEAGARGQAVIVEVDAAAEYTGQSALPYAMADDLAYRMRHARRSGARGFVARVERGSRSILDTPNQVNAWILKRLGENPFAEPGDMVAEFVDRYYLRGASPGEAGRADARAALTRALRRSFDAVRKMYYVRGFWCLEKGSGVPTTITRPKLLRGRSNALWDSGYREWDRQMRAPTPRTLDEIIQEKEEAREIAQRALDSLRADSVRAFFKKHPRERRYRDLVSRFQNLRDCTVVWRHIAEAVFGYQLYRRSKSLEDRAFLEGNLRALERLAAEREAAESPAFPASPGRIRKAVKEMRGRLKPFNGAPRLRNPPLISGIETRGAPGAVTVRFRAPWPARGFVVEYGTRVPAYGKRVSARPRRDGVYSIKIDGLRPGTLYRVRVAGMHEDGRRATSGDYWAWTPMSREEEEEF